MLNVQLDTPHYVVSLSIILVLTSCSVQQKISKSAKQVINDSSLLTAHVGISIYDPAIRKVLVQLPGR